MWCAVDHLQFSSFWLHKLRLSCYFSFLNTLHFSKNTMSNKPCRRKKLAKATGNHLQWNMFFSKVEALLKKDCLARVLRENLTKTFKQLFLSATLG